MPKAIPLDGERRRPRPADAAVAAGVARATGERRRRQHATTPLLAGMDGAAPAPEATDNGTGPSTPSAAAAPAPEHAVLARAAPEQAAPEQAAPEQAAPEQAAPAGAAPEGAAAKKAAPRKAAAKKAAPARAVPKRAAARRAGPAAPRTAGPAKVAARTTRPATQASPTTGPATEAPLTGGPNGAVHDDRVAELVGAAAQVGGWIAEILASNLAPPVAEQKVGAALEFLRRRLTGDYEVDEFGFDEELTDGVLLAVSRLLYRHWFRVEVRGIENIPDTGGALVVANHSGTIALDALMTQVAVHDEHPRRRHLRMLGADLVFQTPFLGWLARKGGATLAGNADAERLLSGGELVGVWPEGFKGVGKPFSERYKLQRFGRGGFVSAALRTRTPIVPCAIVGAEETYPIIGNLPTVARLLGLPYLPITPTFPLLGPLGAIPLPSKWLIEFSAPLPTDTLAQGAQDDPMLVFDLTDQVRQTIQHTLYNLLMQRRSIFF